MFGNSIVYTLAQPVTGIVRIVICACPNSDARKIDKSTLVFTRIDKITMVEHTGASNIAL